MYTLNTSDKFVKSDSMIFAKDEIVFIDCSNIEDLEVKVILKNGKEIILHEIHAIECVMQTKPSLFEGKKLKWPKFVWAFHNIVAHPLTQIFAFMKLYKIAFWIHDVTVPKPLGRKEKNKERK